MLVNSLIVLCLCELAIAQLYRKDHIFINELLSWSKARDYCRYHYVDLSTYESPWEHKQLPKQAKGNSANWIGLHLDGTNWRWIDAVELPYTRWNVSQPDGSGYEKCAVVKEGHWFDQLCDRELNFLCFNWTRKLILVRENKTWEEALVHCRSHHTDLAGLPLGSELLQAVELSSGAQTPNVWISLKFLAGEWLWVDMKPKKGVRRVHLYGLPKCPSQPLHCGALSWKTNSVTNGDCLEKLNFICYEKIGAT